MRMENFSPCPCGPVKWPDLNVKLSLIKDAMPGIFEAGNDF